MFARVKAGSDGCGTGFFCWPHANGPNQNIGRRADRKKKGVSRKLTNARATDPEQGHHRRKGILAEGGEGTVQRRPLSTPALGPSTVCEHDLM
jgi:hypothetical protein